MTRHTQLKIISFTFLLILSSVVLLVDWRIYVTLMCGAVMGFIGAQVAQDVENDYLKADEEESTYED